MVALAEQLGTCARAKRGIRQYQEAEERAIQFDYGIAGEVWIWYGGKVHDYDATFSRVLSALQVGSFRDFLSARASSGLSTNVLDLMGGDASFLRDLKFPADRQVTSSPLDAGLCVTLVDGRSVRLRELDHKLNIDVVCGDLTSKSTWKLIDERQREMGIEAFDAVVCRGADGVAEEVVPKVRYPFLFGKVWGKLADTDTLFATHLPETVDSGEILEQLGTIPGIKVNFQPKGAKTAETYPTLGIIKTAIAPRSLA